VPAKKLHANNLQLIRHNTSLVKKLYPNINRARIQTLKELTKQFSFSFASGDVIQLENGWFVTHTGLVRLARRKRCRGIHVEAVDSLCDSAASRFVLVCVSRLADASDRCPPRFVPRRARAGTRFVDSSSGVPFSRGFRSSFSG